MLCRFGDVVRCRRRAVCARTRQLGSGDKNAAPCGCFDTADLLLHQFDLRGNPRYARCERSNVVVLFLRAVRHIRDRYSRIFHGAAVFDACLPEIFSKRRDLRRAFLRLLHDAAQIGDEIIKAADNASDFILPIRVELLPQIALASRNPRKGKRKRRERAEHLRDNEIRSSGKDDKRALARSPVLHIR